LACYTCGFEGKFKKTKIESYRYTECGLDNVFLRHIPGLQCPECKIVSADIPHPLQLHELLAQMIVTKPFLLTAGEIRFIRTQLGYSQADFAGRLQRNPSVLNRVERKKEKVSADLDRLVRMVYLKEKTSPKRLYEEVENLIGEKREGQRPYRFHTVKNDWKYEARAAA